MLTITILRVLSKASKQKYFIQICILSIMVLAGIVTCLQFEFMEAYEEQEDEAASMFHVDRLMEFVELNRILGVENFIFYKHSLSEKLSCLLSDYVKQGRITVMDWNLPNKEISLDSEIQHEGSLAAHNDYPAHAYVSKYEYTLFLSIDEFIIPKEAKSLNDLIRTKENHWHLTNTGAYVFKVANYYLEWPDEKWNGRNYLGTYLMTIYKTYQTTNGSYQSTKSVCKPKAVLRVGAQNSLQLISGHHSQNVEELQGLCHRYRQAPVGQTPPAVAQALRDTSAHRFAPRLIQALAKQYHISMPHCSLSTDARDVKIDYIGPYNNIPILMDNLNP